MIWHHLFIFPTWYVNGVGINYHLGFIGRFLINVPGVSGNICVQIFAIISGYALFVNPKAYKGWNSRGKRLFKFLGAYWLVYLLFIFIGYLNNDALPSINQFFHNLVGLKTGPTQQGINVPFAWYVTFYIQFIFLIPLLLKIFFNGNHWQDLIGFLLLCILTNFLPRINYTNLFGEEGGKTISSFFVSIPPIISVGMGIIAAKYNLFKKIHNKILNRIPSFIILLFCFADLYLKYKLPQLNRNGGYNWVFFLILSNALEAFILISFLLELINRLKSKVIITALTFLGSLSMYLWFLHGIFFTGKNFMQAELFASREPIIIFLTCLLVLTPIAFIIHKFYTFIWSKIENISLKKLSFTKQ